MSDPTMTPSPHAPEPPDNETPEREPFLKRIRLRRFLSFGPDSDWIDLRNLNVLIGPNGAGKSNFIEAINLLRQAPFDLRQTLGPGMRASHYPWAGKGRTSTFELAAVFGYDPGKVDLSYTVELSGISDTFGVVAEALTAVSKEPRLPELQHGFTPLVVRLANDPERSVIYGANPASPKDLIYNKLGDVDPSQSVLSQRKEPNAYPELFSLTVRLFRILIFRFADLDAAYMLRRPQPTDTPKGDFLNESASNLVKTIQSLEKYDGVMSALNKGLREFMPTFRKIYIEPGMNSNELQFLEDGMQEPIPAARLSDGTLRYLVLLVILLHPSPPPLICIEEPEIGLHPDMISEVGRLLRDASTRTQLIVTTHSDVLLDALSGVPETVVVCAKEDGITQMERLSLQELDAWLADYSLGHLWRQGTIGGNRW